jgi:predicted  nucleic acid-binding Zn-ribbon protein
LRREAQRTPPLPSWERVGVRRRVPVRYAGVRRSRSLGLVLLIVYLAIVLPASAQQDREREALRRAQQMVSRLQQDNAGLQREKAELEQKLAAAEAELKKSQGQAGQLRRSTKALATAEKDKADLEGKLAQIETRLKDTEQSCREQVAGLRKELQDTQAALETVRRDGEQTAARLSSDLAAQTSRAEGCEDKNAKLYGVTTDLIDRYKENRGAWERFLLSEPFTQLKAVEVENLLEEMRERAAEQRIQGSGLGAQDSGVGTQDSGPANQTTGQ